MNDNNNAIHNLIWVDLEMTGINPDLDHILEIALVITDQQLNIIDDSFNIVINQSPEILALMNDFVKNLHTNNGLLALIPKSNIDLITAENQALAFVQQYVAKNTSPICGNSICMDRRFLFKYMPRLENFFHYRNLDVSTVKNLGIYWFPEKVASLNKEEGSHRAKDDILQSIDELRFYKQKLFQ
jgi:oligoribonuclease